MKLRLYIGILTLFTLLFIASCVKRVPKWYSAPSFKEVVESPLQDMFDHKLLAQLGANVVPIPAPEYDEELKGFVNQFVEDAKNRGVLISSERVKLLRKVVWVDRLTISPGKIGVMASCNRFFSNQTTLSGKKPVNWMTIEVLRESTKRYTGDHEKSVILLREIMYHELGHCLGGWSHLKTKKGIMSASFSKGNKRAFKEWRPLVDEMFSPEYLADMDKSPL